MAKKAKKTQKVKGEALACELVTVAFAEDIEQARDYKQLLQNNEIPAAIKKSNSESAHGIAVMVPEDYLDEAHVLIEFQYAYDDFYDLAFENDESGILDDEFLDDSF